MTKNQPIVVLDAGHGGSAPAGKSSPTGARGSSGTPEKDVVLDLARRVAGHLGNRAVLTRRDDSNLPLAERAAMCRRYGAQVFVSLHAGSGAIGQRGAEAWVHSRATPESYQLAESLRRELVAYGGGPAARQVSAADLAVLAPDYLGPSTAACLLEVDSLLDPQGERRLRDPANLDRLGSAIARGIEGYVSRPKGAVAGRRYPISSGQEAAPDDPQRDPGRDTSRSFFEIVDDNTAPVPARTLGYVEGLEGVDTVINLGKTAWDVMKDNRPVANATSDFANALPQGARLEDVTGWDPAPRTMRLHYHSENKLGFNSTDIYLTFSWYFNGAWNNVGQWIDAATVIATGDVAWGNTINVTASINSPINTGTRTAPIGGLPVRVRLTESNVVQNMTQAWEGLLQGNGAGKVSPV
jgi:N-acetylmuramoyl-L-alanine amidase